jgi:hypothetical protein
MIIFSIKKTNFSLITKSMSTQNNTRIKLCRSVNNKEMPTTSWMIRNSKKLKKEKSL